MKPTVNFHHTIKKCVQGSSHVVNYIDKVTKVYLQQKGIAHLIDAQNSLK